MTRGKTGLRVVLVLAILPAVLLALSPVASSHRAGQASPAIQDTDRLERSLDRAVEAANAGGFDEALRLYRELEQSASQIHSWAGISGQVITHRMAGDEDSARAVSQRIASERPELAGLMAVWDGDTAVLEGDFSGALEAYQKSLDLYGKQSVDGKPVGATALQQMARLQLRLGDARAAALAERELLKTFPRSINPEETVATILAYEAMASGDLPLKPLAKLLEDGDCSAKKPCVLGSGRASRRVPRNATRVHGMDGLYFASDPAILGLVEQAKVEATAEPALDAMALACTPSVATNGFMAPLDGYWVSGYSFMSYPDCCGGWHPGVDLGADNVNAKDFKSTAKGCVRDIWNGSCSDWGSVAVEHYYTSGYPWFSQYGHGDKVYVSVSQSVSKGQALGQVGCCGGYCTGPHLHFEIREKDHPAPGNAGSYYNSPQSAVGDYYNDPMPWVAAHRSYSALKALGQDNCTYTGTWYSVTGIGDGDDKMKYGYTTPTTDTSRQARCDWKPTSAGTYGVWAFIPWNHATSAKAIYKLINLTTGAVLFTKTVNQNVLYDAWVKLGSASLTTTNNYRLRVQTNTGESNRKVGVDSFLFIKP